MLRFDKSTRVVVVMQVCDQRDDCRDGQLSDELDCPVTTCPPGRYKCSSTNVCVSRRQLCDGDNDCGDNSDENSILCQTAVCDNGSKISLKKHLNHLPHLILSRLTLRHLN